MTKLEATRIFHVDQDAQGIERLESAAGPEPEYVMRGLSQRAAFEEAVVEMLAEQTAEAIHALDQRFEQLYRKLGAVSQEGHTNFGAPNAVLSAEQLLTSGIHAAAAARAHNPADREVHRSGHVTQGQGSRVPSFAGKAVAEALGQQLAEIVHSLDQRFDQLDHEIHAALQSATSRRLKGISSEDASALSSSAGGSQRSDNDQKSVWFVQRRRPDVKQQDVKADETGTPGVPTREALPKTVGGGSAVPTAEPMAASEISKDEAVGDEDFSAGWEGRAWAQDGTELCANGVVRATGQLARAGIVTRLYDFAAGGLLEVELRGEVLGAGRPTLRIVSEAGEGIGPDFAVGKSGGVFRAFAPARTSKIKIYLLMMDTEAGDCFKLDGLALKKLDPDQHQHRVRAITGEPVLASMASIPSRRDMLADCINSLVVQCDKVRVFLNNYPDVPDFLVHPKIEVRRSQDWDDRGDAGKVFWLEQDKTPGYRLIVDDDLIFPPDFAEVMCAKVAAKEKKAIYAAHGVLVRQPVKNYYDDRSRAATFHFARALAEDHRVHIGATNALCLHSDAISMHWDDFKYSNSADMWLALHAQEKNLQVLTPARPSNWVRENRHAAPDETIYNHSRNRTRTRFDSSLVQDAVLKFHWPLTVKVGNKPKYCLLVVFKETKGLAEGIEQFIARTRGEAEWIVMLAYDRSVPALEEAVAGMKIERETHLVDTAAKPDGLAQAIELVGRLGVASILCVNGNALTADLERTPVDLGTPEQWQDMTVVRLKVGQNESLAGMILAGGAAALDDFKSALEGLALPAPESSFADFAKVLLRRKVAVVPLAAKTPEATVNSVFKRVKVLNLDRRADRWESVSRSLALAGIEAESFAAVDGNLPNVAAEYERYLELPKVTVSSDIPKIRYQRDLYMEYTSQAARVAYLEREGKKAIASRGAWGYLKSYEAVLEEALIEGTESLLVFDDDVLLHKDISTLFAQAMSQLPDNWLLLQFGTLQYNWSPPWAEWYSPLLYKTNGSAVGSHAVGMRFDVIPFLLDHVRRFDMPYDIGALSAATRAFADRCFVICPNLAIQSLLDSDIGTSDFQKAMNRENAAATYKWNFDDYR